jgi:urease accessory protein
VYFTTFGGGLVDGDAIDVLVAAGPRATGFIGTQSATKVYRSSGESRGCHVRLALRAEEDSAVAIVADPVMCFAGSRFAQRVDVSLAAGASAILLDGYTCGRAARGERWEFARFETRTTIERLGARILVDATCLDPAHGPLRLRMHPFGAVLSLVAVGPRFAPVRDAMLAAVPAPSAEAVVTASSFGPDGALLRVAADRFERAYRVLRECFMALARVLGDDPFARKW